MGAPVPIRWLSRTARTLATRVAKSFARRRRHRREGAILRESGLFDAEFYRSQGPFEGDPITHFLVSGAHEGRAPHPLFDTAYYRERYPDVARSVGNPLVHYLTRGAGETRNPNAYFDGRFYADAGPPLPAGENPLVHFLREGAARGRATSPAFDAQWYLAEYPDVAASGVTPLVHYLRWGAAEGRSPSAAGPIDVVHYPDAAPILAPTEAEWASVSPRRAEGAAVDVIIPVYRGEADTLRAIHRVLTSPNRTAFELVVIDDASPEPALASRLRELGESGLFTYLRNETNLGFVGTVNRGMALHPNRDVVLLNSDTEVFGDWVDRLHATVRANADVGTVTPFSNSATICSYPTFPRDNAMRLELGYDELDALAAEIHPVVEPALLVDLPTAVGFCMYITRACLEATGPFDEARFGKGYGEENDFCRRALALGFRNVFAANVFVRHTGGASFLGEKAERVARAMEILREMYPDYLPSVASFVERDPIRVFRERLDLARVRRVLGPRAFAIVTHRLGGGTERHVRDLVAMAAREGVGVLVLRPDARSADRFHLDTGIDAPLPNLPILRLDDPTSSRRLFDALGIRHLHVHHVMGFSGRIGAWIETLAASPGFTVDYTIHDYAPICPRINLVDASGRYCGEPDRASCNRCIEALGSSFGRVDIDAHRAANLATLARARRVFVPNVDVKRRLERYFPGLDVTVKAHAEDASARSSGHAPFVPGHRLRVVVLGALEGHKGYELVIRMADDARRRSLPLDFVVVGYTADDDRARNAGIEVTGRYVDDDEALSRLEEVAAHVALFPALWPETHSYTLSLALDAGLHPVAFDLGAIAERLGTLGDGTRLPVAWMAHAGRVNDALVDLGRAPLSLPRERPAQTRTVAEYYDDLV